MLTNAVYSSSSVRCRSSRRPATSSPNAAHRLPTRATVVSRIASRTSRRWASIVSFHSFGISRRRRVDAQTRSIDTNTMYRKLPPRSGPAENTHMADSPPYPGTPRWVKVSGTIAIILAVLFIILQLTGVIGRHGPGRHGGHGQPASAPQGRTPRGDHSGHAAHGVGH
jgi:hypothetical protein